ncbi:MAG TPA: cache domain-containing protein [Candidatus Methanoperedens sp.]|nr:cache domain-containing protein [Candidatus Methanoperedens sp.]
MEESKRTGAVSARRLRLILAALVVLVALTAIAGVRFFYQGLRERVIREEQSEAGSENAVYAQFLSASIDRGRRSAALLAGLPEVAGYLENPGATALERLHGLLDRFQRDLGVEVAYLMDARGIVAAASNRGTPESFLGRDYAFRPYFREAMSGGRPIYPALGVTTKKRGIYFGHPVRHDPFGPPLGVVVLKYDAEILEQAACREGECTILITDANGVISLSPRKDLLYKSIWRIDEGLRERIAASRQYGPDAAAWSGFSRSGDQEARDAGGSVYWLQEQEIPGAAGWKVFHLHATEMVRGRVFASLRQLTGLLLALFFLLILVATLLFHRLARREIAARLRLEEERERTLTELQQALGEVRTLSGLLPICASCKKIRDDKGYWNQIETYISGRSEAKFSHGLCPECLPKYFGDYLKTKEE